MVNGTVGYSTMLTNTTLKTVGGGNMTIRVQDDGVFVNEAKVTVPDVLVANGVVHVIDGYVFFGTGLSSLTNIFYAEY